MGGTAENGFPEARVPEQRDQELSEATVEKKNVDFRDLNSELGRF